MARKYYEAPNTVISGLSLIVGGRPMRVSFSPISVYEGSHTGRGSMLITDNTELQQALEASPLFGGRFRIFRVEETEKKAETKAEANEGEAESDNVDELKHIGADEVGSLNDAREYLAKNFGIEKKKISSTKAILNAAAANGVVFDALQ